jgi:carboxymethylenebutenolidase
MAERDLAALWEAHCRHEFETLDLEATMASMVAQPYVNHVPTMAGGVGVDQLRWFYKHHFIGANPPDTALTLVGRTVGADSLVDEMLFSFTHTSEVDWMLPGVPPSGRKVEIPLVAIVKFEGDKLAHEHIMRPGLGAGPDRRTRSRRAAGGRPGDGEESHGQDPPQQRAHGRVGQGRRLKRPGHQEVARRAGAHSGPALAAPKRTCRVSEMAGERTFDGRRQGRRGGVGAAFGAGRVLP